MTRAQALRLYCSECHEKIGIWDEKYSWCYGRHTGIVCGDCFDRLFDEMSRYEKAMLVGSEVYTPEAGHLPS